MRIEDILPFFPDSVLIDEFKEEICNSLKVYNKHIDALETEMDEATQSADNIRKEIESLKYRFVSSHSSRLTSSSGFVPATQACYYCRLPLTRTFYMFPCQHLFHQKCLADEMTKHISSPLERNKVMNFADSLGRNQIVPLAFQEEIDNIIACECPLCGDIMIDAIDVPLYNPHNQSLTDSWRV